MQEISSIRFNALAGYARDPRTVLTAEELGYFEHANERVLGILVRDRTDNDFAGMILARDELKQYRWTGMTEWESTPRRARALLRPALERAAMAPDEEHHQGHVQTTPVDFFTPIVPENRLNKDFETLIRQEGFSPALGIIEPMMRWYDDVDGNFVEQFQTTAFDARLWELYLFAALIEMGFALDRTKAAPDFIARSLFGAFAMEAATVNPTKDKQGAIVTPPPTETDEEQLSFLREYMPIKFGSALYSKLVKEYWAKEHVRDLPFVLAIEDFSAPGSMMFTRSALQLYLYGYDQDVGFEGRKRVIIPRRVASHRWLDKEIPSGFFFLPGAENVSAVIFSNSGTISKFNRLGLVAGFGSRRLKMYRRGLAYNHAQNAIEPIAFERDVSDPDYTETWVEGLDVFHNPRAVKPIERHILPGAAHHYLLPNGIIKSMVPQWHPLGSQTLIGSPAPTSE